MSTASNHARPDDPPGQESLPTVTPPTAGFLIALFVVPGTIVATIVGLWLLFNWLASDAGDPRTYLSHLRSDTDKRWHAAFYLASALSDTRHNDLRHDAKFMSDLAEVLDDEIDGASMADDQITMRTYLCRALAHFRVTSGLPTLVKAAHTERDPAESDVRLAALESIAILTENVREPLVKSLLPEAAKIGAHLSAADSGELRRVTQACARLAADARRVGDFGHQAAALARELAELASKPEAIDANSAGAMDDLRRLAARMALQARSARDVDWRDEEEPARSIVKAAGQRHDRVRRDQRLRRDDVSYAHLLRERAAFAMGVVGGPAAAEELKRLLSDGSPNVEYNAAAGLCRQGVVTPEVVDVLTQMLTAPRIELQEPFGGWNEAQRREQESVAKQQVTLAGLGAVKTLVGQSESAELAPVVAAVESLAQSSETPAHVRVEAIAVQQAIREHR